MLKQILCENPFKHKKRTTSRGTSWEGVAKSLIDSGMNVVINGKSIRGRFENLRAKFITRMNIEKRGSGIVAEHGEFEQLMQDIIDLERDETVMIEEKSEEEKEKEKETMEKAEGIRKRCMKRMKEKAMDEEPKTKKGKESATLDYLREKSEKQMALKRKGTTAKRKRNRTGKNYKTKRKQHDETAVK